MRKMFGAAAILLGCFLSAWCRIRAGRRREAVLLLMRDSLTEFRRELTDRRGGMRDILTSLAGRNARRETGPFFDRICADMDELGEKSFSEIWRSGVAGELRMLGEGAADTVGALGDSLGGSELALQCEALENAAHEMERLARKEREALPGERRMSFGLSLAAGAMLVIVLI